MWRSQLIDIFGTPEYTTHADRTQSSRIPQCGAGSQLGNTAAPSPKTPAASLMGGRKHRAPTTLPKECRRKPSRC